MDKAKGNLTVRLWFFFFYIFRDAGDGIMW
nr:MAG TPA: hypothetical protein [Caudoviricetes sp.]